MAQDSGIATPGTSTTTMGGAEADDGIRPALQVIVLLAKVPVAHRPAASYLRTLTTMLHRRSAPFVPGIPGSMSPGHVDLLFASATLLAHPTILRARPATKLHAFLATVGPANDNLWFAVCAASPVSDKGKRHQANKQPARASNGLFASCAEMRVPLFSAASRSVPCSLRSAALIEGYQDIAT
ncbi:hypothetical protein JX265_002708 [Neoarthrinium moseri]|uniref:Uncharacterized protein n=1 Tax=Neoarthrinium moseri TaxID=1658444 RepID=A0A9P9WUY6_9PEZI|nr:hypothetical protein JX265_002708 [Neoarthrinium moseri]